MEFVVTELPAPQFVVSQEVAPAFTVTQNYLNTFAVTVLPAPVFRINLATGIPGAGVPAGGSVGEVLKKKTSANYDTEWAFIDAASSKAGLVDGGDFTGSPMKFEVVFSIPYSDDQYAITINGTDSRAYTYEDKTDAGFTINANAAHSISGEVSWIALPVGET